MNGTEAEAAKTAVGLLSTFQPGSVPMWGTFLILLTTIGGLWLKGRKLTLDSASGIRDHYARELTALRAQVLAVQTAADARVANAEARYTEAVSAADARHHSCEEECDRLRDRVVAMERRFQQLHETALRLFQPREDLPEAMKVHIRSLEQLAPPNGRASYGGDGDD